MKNILFMAIEFAPYQTTGAFRSIYFVKYLREFGIEPIVLTINPEAENQEYNSKLNNELLELIPKDTIIHRSLLKTTKNYKNKLLHKLQLYFKINDRNAKNWQKSVLLDLPSIIEKHSPQAIYVSCPPDSSGILARKISEKYNLPLIVDMRDGWSHWCVSPYSTYIHYFLTFLSEKKTFNKASKIITVTKELSSTFKKSHTNIPESNFEVITNGFDCDTIPVYLNFEGLKNSKKEINIAYIGSYYYNPQARKDMMTPNIKKSFHKKLQYSPVKEDWLYRSPYFLLQALEKLIIKYPALESKLFFTHIGNKPHWMDEMVASFNLTKNVKYTGFLNHNELSKKVTTIDLFLSTSVKVINGEDYAIASKTFDYITNGKPTLGFVTNGSQSNFLTGSNTGVIFNPDESEDSVNKLYQIITNGLSLKINKEYLDKFHRKNTTKKLSEVIHSLN